METHCKVWTLSRSFEKEGVEIPEIVIASKESNDDWSKRERRESKD